MAEEQKDDRTEPATPFRRDEARKKGKVARSADVGQAAVFLGGILVLWATGSMISGALARIFRDCLGNLVRPDFSSASAARMVADTCFSVIVPLAPVLVGMAAISAAAGLAQVGFSVTTDPLIPKPEKFDPSAGFKRLFSLRSSVTLGTSLVKITVVLIVGYITVRSYIPALVALHHATPATIAKTMSTAAFDLCVRTGLALLVIAAVDYGYQKWQYEREMRMTKQEVKDEMKMTEGNPEIQSRIRRVQMALSRGRMLRDVKKADVVVRNPTHYAVALKYDAEKSSAPLVLAKGKDLLAKRIVELARKHKVPMIHEAPLAQALYKSVEVGEVIPPKLYRAVARILVQVFKLRGKRPGAATPAAAG